jgi:uncharacterized membrane protein YidH (DUF202 family)
MSRPTAARDQFADDPFLDALQRTGALSRKDARARSELPPVAEDLLAVFIATGTVRAARGGRYYLVSRTGRRDRDMPARFTPFSVTLMLAVWIVVLLGPLVGWLIAR